MEDVRKLRKYMGVLDFSNQVYFWGVPKWECEWHSPLRDTCGGRTANPTIANRRQLWATRPEAGANPRYAAQASTGYMVNSFSA